MDNRQLSDVFTLIANLSEIKGEIIYKTLAYRKAAESLLGLGRDVNEYWKEGTLEEIPGVGKAIAEKIDELLRTGKLEFLEKLEKEVPASLADWLQVPGLGPKKVALIWKELGITTLPELEKAARAGKLRALPGMGEKSEAQILAGIESLARRSGRLPLGRAYPLAQQIIAALKKVPGVRRRRAGRFPAAHAPDRRRPGHPGGRQQTSARSWRPSPRSRASCACWARARPSPPSSSATACAPRSGSTRRSASAPPCSTPPARRTTTCACASWPWSKGLSLSEHALLQARTVPGRSPAPPRRKSTPPSACPGFRPSCARTAARCRPPRPGSCRGLIELADIHADLQMHSTW